MPKYIGNGTTLAVATGTTGSAGQVIGGVMSISGPEGSAADVDTTTLDSTSNYQTWQRGFRDAGEISFDVAYDPADAGWLDVKAIDASGRVVTWTLNYSATALSDETFNAYISGVGRAVERDSMITRSITLHCSTGPGFN